MNSEPHTSRPARRGSRRLRIGLPLLLPGLLAASGCIKRTLVIESEPPGAKVWFDHIEAGRTPLSIRFTQYGSHSLIIHKKGFRPFRGKLRLAPGGWAVFPLDFFSEALLPAVIKDERAVRIKLEKASGKGRSPESRQPVQAGPSREAR